MRYFYLDYHHRLEPLVDQQDDLQRGFTAEVADPLWFLGRQWQMGEHKGENAATPALAQVHYSRTPLAPMPGRPGEYPGDDQGQPITPAEAIVEGETEDWWTVGRRIRIGLKAAPQVDAILITLPQEILDDKDRARLRLPELPAPYEIFSAGYDGLALYAKKDLLNLPDSLFAGVPQAQRGDHWQPAEMVYEAEFPCGNTSLEVIRHDGGDVDWWSVEAQAPPAEAAEKGEISAQPARLRYPGAPHPRWWQIENAQVDIGGFPPDRSHFPTMLLLDLLLSHSDDWFTIPIRPPHGRIGDLLTLHTIEVTDVFGDSFTIKPQDDNWSLFQIKGLQPASLALFPTAATPLLGDALEQVALGIDEDANLLFAVEERANGRHLATLYPDPVPEPVNQPDLGQRQGYLYRPSSPIPQRWHPYVLDDKSEKRRFVQARLADYVRLQKSGNTPDDRPEAEETWLAPEPEARLLYNDHAQEGDPVHHIEPSAVPVQGLRLDRRFVLARRTDGAPVLWIQRRRQPLLSPPASGLRFDALSPLSEGEE